jgi:type III restriction enzyme
MAKAIISYDKDLPEIPDRLPWEKPSSYLVKDPDAPTGWREEKIGRRPSKMLLVSKLRAAVDAWRQGDLKKGIEPYAGACDVTKRLFQYWFEEDHEVSGFNAPFRYYFCQREAIETLAFVVEVAQQHDAKELIDAYGQVFQRDLLTKSIEYQTTIDGQRQVRRYVPEVDGVGVQDLPPEGLRRYAFKMATGAGKTWVMAMAIVWSYFNRKLVPGSDLSTNFLIVAPNVIVYQRLEKDFANNHVFHQLPLVPPEWGPWNMKVILRGQSAEPNASGNLFLTNIHQLYESREQQWLPTNAVEALLGKRPSKDLAASERSMLERVRSLKDLVVVNDEAHHVHDPELEWSKSLLGIHQALPKGLALWLDFSATPKDQNGMYYPWILSDYPLAQAVEDRIVKAPLIVTKEDDPKLPKKDPDHITKDNVADKYGYWLEAAVDRWKDHRKAYGKLGPKPVLFIMAEKNVFADAIGEYLWKTKEFGFKESEVLTIHTDEAGEITKKDLDKAREAARDIDLPDSKIKAIVSVMMLREGWDVKSVTVALGLRPFEAKAEILPEQVVGRGLRLMTGIGPDRTQTLEVLGTRNLLDFLRGQLEAEGVGVATATKGAVDPVTIYPVLEKVKYDIAIPITKPQLTHDIRKLSALDPLSLNPIFDQDELEETFRITLRMEFATTETEVHQADIAASWLPMTEDLLSSITDRVVQQARLSSVFSELYPLIRAYVSQRCFGGPVDIDADNVRTHLHRLDVQEAVAKYLARVIGELTVERQKLEFANADFRLSKTEAFHWKRNLPPLMADKTIFNYVATYNPFEREFAEFLDRRARDVLRFASLGTTEQGESGTEFRIDYLKPSGAIGFYHPDWVVVQKTSNGPINWIMETKGRKWEGTEEKDLAMAEWCQSITEYTGDLWQFKRIDQTFFNVRRSARSLAELLVDVDRRLA